MPPKQTGPFELTLRFRFHMTSVMLQIPSDKTSLADMRPILLHAVNSTNALAPAPQLEIDLDDANDAPQQQQQATTVKDCRFYRLDSSGRTWKAVDNDKASISGQGFKRDDVVAVSFPDDQGEYFEPTVEPFEGEEAL